MLRLRELARRRIDFCHQAAVSLTRCWRSWETAVGSMITRAETAADDLVKAAELVRVFKRSRPASRIWVAACYPRQTSWGCAGRT